MARGKAKMRSRAKVEKVMHEFKEGSLHSGSGGVVKSRKQAIAIALNEGRRVAGHSRMSPMHKRMRSS